MQWWYGEANKPVGPMSEEEFAKLAASGQIGEQTLVWHEGMEKWVAYGKVADRPAAPAPVAPPSITAPPAQGRGVCRECGREFSLDEMVRYENMTVCAECKPLFLQRIREGAETASGGTGKTPNRDLMEQARQRLKGNWGLAMGFCVVFGIIAGAIGGVGALVGAVVPAAGNVLQLLILPPFELGVATFFVAMNRRSGADFNMLTSGFNRYGNCVGAFFFRNLFVGLWSLLALIPAIVLVAFALAHKDSQFQSVLIALAVIAAIPGVVVSVAVSLMYSMTFFVLADDPAVGVFAALRRSKTMTRGVKWKLFCLGLRFVGWIFLSILTCLIGLLWVVPYLNASYAAFYDDVRGRLGEVQ